MPQRQDPQDRQEQWAIFWCTLLSPLLFGDVSQQQAGRFLRQLAQTEQTFPDGTRRKPSRATLWRKYKQYQQGGFEALFRRRRNDRGKPRKASQAMIDKAVELKKDQPYRSDETINQFLKRETRTVHADFSDVQLGGLFFRVDPELRGDKVQVRFDPFCEPDSEPDSVLIYTLDGEFLTVAQRHQRQGSDSQPAPNALPAKPKHNYIDLLIHKHDQTIRLRTSGIDYAAAIQHAAHRWPFVEFAKQLASQLGRQGGLSAFRNDELETLQKFYHRLSTLDAPLLQLACERAHNRTIPEILFLLQQLHDERTH